MPHGCNGTADSCRRRTPPPPGPPPPKIQVTTVGTNEKKIPLGKSGRPFLVNKKNSFLAPPPQKCDMPNPPPPCPPSNTSLGLPPLDFTRLADFTPNNGLLRSAAPPPPRPRGADAPAHALRLRVGGAWAESLRTRRPLGFRVSPDRPRPPPAPVVAGVRPGDPPIPRRPSRHWHAHRGGPGPVCVPLPTVQDRPWIGGGFGGRRARARHRASSAATSPARPKCVRAAGM